MRRKQVIQGMFVVLTVARFGAIDSMEEEENVRREALDCFEIVNSQIGIDGAIYAVPFRELERVQLRNQ
jgi:hypothetical protein